jgi:P-type conjugative transfer protein TrbJ
MSRTGRPALERKEKSHGWPDREGFAKSRSQTWRSPYSSLQAIDQSISHTQQLLNQAQRLTGDIRIDQAFRGAYPKSYPLSTSLQELIGDAQKRWQNSLAACQDALRVQASVMQAQCTLPRSADYCHVAAGEL